MPDPYKLSRALVDLEIVRAPTGGALDYGKRRVGAPTEEVSPAHTVTDLSIVSGTDALAQALWLRLATPRGELAHLGHPEYGSRLHELVGRVDRARGSDPQLAALAALYVREALRHERRLRRIVSIDVVQSAATRAVVVRIVVEVDGGARIAIEQPLPAGPGAASEGR